jgi:SAM-dependent methyltransferase
LERTLDAAAAAWQNFHTVYQKLGPPLRPSLSDVKSFARATVGCKRILLLGVTPELTRLGQELTAIDNSEQMLDKVWPGDDHHRKAVLGDWTKLPFSGSSFDAVVGDGSLNSAPEHIDGVIREARRVLTPGGILVLRVFCSPDQPESLADIEYDGAIYAETNIHALKWRIAMALARNNDRRTVPVEAILDAFNRLFPDRALLARTAGWAATDIATIDAYRGASHSLSFPTLTETLKLTEETFRCPRVHVATGYPLAELCPTISWISA